MKIAIAGRPNTGKSTLFNALTRSRDALVHDRPGVTRDVLTGTWRISDDLTAEVFDTAGLDRAGDAISKQSTEFALAAIRGADGVIFLVDGRNGLHPDDIEWARVIKKSGVKNIILVANKMESKRGSENLPEFYKLGFGAPYPISAEHRTGLDAVYDWAEKVASRGFVTPAKAAAQVVSNNNLRLATGDWRLDRNSQMRVAIMGQPNVGKSTLINRIAGQNRVIVHDMPGVTRDTVAIPAHVQGRDITIYDTAGLRRKSKIDDGLETLAALKSLDVLDRADAVILIADATREIENQMLMIAARVYDAGKILCVALNKWDLVSIESRDEVLLKLKHQFKNSFHQIIAPLILPVSAQTGTGVPNMMKRLFETWDISNDHAATSIVNRTIEKLIAARQPPMSRLKRPMKIKFAHQTKTHPITIAINVGGASDIPESYTRYLRRGLAKALNWERLPVVIEYQKSENPYEKA